MIRSKIIEDGICIVRPGSERLTAANAKTFKAETLDLIEAGHDRIVIDFGEVIFVDSSGLGAMVGLLKKVGNRGEIVVCGLSGTVTQMFSITRMDRVFASYYDADDAIHALQERV
ncbi:STAS domain-containing protein [Palleronia sp. LCG004]|uniref:STAS domain-containing protein n=1 Tax=Palleronia sp. LCG004 TaxID=3079304 RepID=UPI002943E071|nr:STAS domain-containing protein [Palleronia sp. LCG004]WOI57439.1 STAS domain-containing protein [Palleronia sp. LCG004]